MQHSPSSWIIDVNHVQLTNEIVEVLSSKPRSEDISCLFLGTNIRYTNNPSFNLFLDKMSINFYMLSLIVLDWIVCNAYCSVVITEEFYWMIDFDL